MSGDDLIKSINEIKISISENDQTLWKCQAAAKCYHEATEKLKEKCDQLNTEMAKIDEEIGELEPHVEMLASCYETQFETLTLIPQSLVNHRLHKKCIVQNIKKHQQEVDKIVDEYCTDIQKRKAKLELTNPAYRTLQIKKTELKQCKVRCLDMKQKISELKRINKQKMEIRQKLFYRDIISFAESWLSHDKYFKAMRRLNEEKRMEREYVKKLAEATELLKQKQKNRFCQKESTFKIPQINFPKTDIGPNIKERPEKAGKQFNNCLDDIKKMLEKENINMIHPVRNDNLNIGDQNKSQKFEFNASNSKVRILENRTLKPHTEMEQLFPKSKEERSKEIAAKLQKVVDNFNKNISRQNSKNVISSQKSTSSNFDERLSQKASVRQEGNATKMDVVEHPSNVQHEKTGASQQLQNLTLTNMTNNNQEAMFLSQECPKNFNQSSKNQYQRRSPRLSQETEFPKRREYNFRPQDTFGNKNYSQESKTKGSTIPLMIPDRQVKKFEGPFGEKTKFTMPTSAFGGINMDGKNTVEEKKSITSIGRDVSFKKQDVFGVTDKPHFVEETKTIGNPSESVDTSLKKPVFVEKNQFMMGDSGNEFINNLNNRNNEHGAARKPTENFARDNESYMKMAGIPSYNFGNDTQFSQILNTSYDYDTSQQFDQTYFSPVREDNDINGATNFGGPSNFADQPLFSFGKINRFSFK